MKFWYNTLDEIPEAMRQFYSQQDGKYRLNCEGAVDQKRLEEFRDNNVELTKKLKAWETAAGEVKLEDLPALILKKKEIEEARVKDKTDLDKKLDERIAAMKVEHDKAIKERDEKIAAKDAALNKAVIQTTVLEKASKLGLVDGASEDLIRRATETWVLDDKGQAVAMKDGKEIYGTDASPLTMDAWLEGLTKSAAFLFKPSAGGGSAGGAGGQGGRTLPAGANPFKKGSEHFSLTAQGQLFAKDPALARKLAEEAGTPLPASA